MKRSISLNQDKPTQSWLVFSDRKELEQENQTVITVRNGEKFAQISKNLLTINLNNSQEYEKLFQTLQELGKIPEVIAWEMSEYFGFDSLLFLVQAIHRTQITPPIQLTVITRNLYDVINRKP